jgi:phage gpG-like protein
MINLSVSTNFDQIERTLATYQASLADNSEALATVADDLRAMIAEQFATEGASGGAPWVPLAPSTLRKARRTRAGILDSTGALLGSLIDPGAPGHVEVMSGQELLFGSALPYAIFHQTGTGIGFGQTGAEGPQPSPAGARKGRKFAGPGRGRALPMRPLLIVTEARAETWVEMVRRGIAAKTLLLGAKELA